MTSKEVKSNIKKIIKCMDYTCEKMYNNNIYCDLYQILGSYAWTYISDHCKHEFKKSKKFPKGKCKNCGVLKK